MRPDLAGDKSVRRQLTRNDFIALRSLAKEPWRLPNNGFGFYWKFNKTWRRTWPEETAAGWAAAASLRELGLVEEHYCCPTASLRMQLQLTARGVALLARINQPAPVSAVTYPAPKPMPAPRRGWLLTLAARLLRVVGVRCAMDHSDKLRKRA